MLIRAEQMTVFEGAAEENFARRLTAHLLENYPAAKVRLAGSESAIGELPEETLHSLVVVSIERARRCNLTLESSISAFSAVMFEVSPNFDTHRLSQVMLRDENVEPDARLDELLEVLTEKNWETIRGDYDETAWQSENLGAAEKFAEVKDSDFAETARNIDVTKKSAKSAPDEEFDFADTVPNIKSG